MHASWDCACRQGEGACTWRRFLPVPFLQVVFWEGQWWAPACLPPLFLGCLTDMAVSHKAPSGGVYPGPHAGLAAGPLSTAPVLLSAPAAVAGRSSLEELRIGLWKRQQSFQQQPHSQSSQGATDNCAVAVALQRQCEFWQIALILEAGSPPPGPGYCVLPSNQYSRLPAQRAGRSVL